MSLGTWSNETHTKRALVRARNAIKDALRFAPELVPDVLGQLEAAVIASQRAASARLERRRTAQRRRLRHVERELGADAREAVKRMDAAVRAVIPGTYKRRDA